MWYGEYNHTLDDKDRVVLPAKFRNTIKENKLKSFYLTRGLDKCLYMYTDSEWQKQIDKIKTFPDTKSEVRAFQRMYVSGAAGVSVDSQGRVLIPAHLKQFASIKKDVVVLGVGERIEVWDKSEWEKFYESNKESFEKIAEHLAE